MSTPRSRHPVPPCRSRHAQAAWRQGYERVAGVDEVGRGCLFGPVVAAAVVLDPLRPVPGLRDSKQLTPPQRDELAALIRERAVAWSWSAVPADQIDAINILQATRLAMRQAVLGLSPTPDFLLIDALTIEVPLPQRGLIRGDAEEECIAAASILAKVERDALVTALDLQYPGYGLCRNKGYGTPEHLRGLAAHGPTPLHRRSFAPVAAYCPTPV